MLVHLMPTGSGNLTSVKSGLRELGHDTKNLEEESNLAVVRKVLIPGVGSFRKAMEYMNSKDSIQKLDEYLKLGGQVLGICLGMQILAREGKEDGVTKGLGVIEGDVIPFKDESQGITFKTHVGFNNLEMKRESSALLRNVQPSDDFYFTHSFYLTGENPLNVSAVTQASVEIVSVIEKDGHIFGTQFHPEKSQSQGLRVIQNFMNI